MTFRGIIRNGQIEVSRGIDLPEGTHVSIEPTEAVRKTRATPTSNGKDPAFKIGDRAVSMGVADLAAQHDHYLYGTPKRKAASRSTEARAGRAKAARSKKGGASRRGGGVGR